MKCVPKDGLEYELESLKSMLAALDRHLIEHDYKCSTIRDREFYQSKLVLEGIVKTSSPVRKREEAERGKCTDSQRRNTLDGRDSRRFQSKSS